MRACLTVASVSATLLLMPVAARAQSGLAGESIHVTRITSAVTIDDHAFYAAFEFDDPNPRSIRAPFGDHDHISGNTTAYGGVILDTRHDGHSAVLLLASAAGIRYDAVTDDDGSGEDSAPDFFWEAAAHVNDHGWTLELRVPFSSLRYRNVDPQTWGNRSCSSATATSSSPTMPTRWPRRAGRSS